MESETAECILPHPLLHSNPRKLLETPSHNFPQESLSLDQIEELINQLPTSSYGGCESLENLYLYQGCWYFKSDLIGTIICKNNPTIVSTKNNVILTTFPKSGTTWFKALIYTIINRNSPYLEETLSQSSPHDFAKWIEYYAYKHPDDPMPKEDILILSTHVPFDALPMSFQTSPSPIVYVSRNPKDNFISLWHFLNKMKRKGTQDLELIPAFESFCQGVSHYGPFWDHALSYWRASLLFPEKVLFLRYEDMKYSHRENIKKLAQFIGHPISKLEEEEGVVDKINHLCSFESLSSLAGNRNKTIKTIAPVLSVSNDMFFRKGEVGDHKNFLTPSMIERLDKITNEKLADSGLRL